MMPITAITTSSSITVNPRPRRMIDPLPTNPALEGRQYVARSAISWWQCKQIIEPWRGERRLPCSHETPNHDSRDRSLGQQSPCPNGLFEEPPQCGAIAGIQE